MKRKIIKNSVIIILLILIFICIKCNICNGAFIDIFEDDPDQYVKQDTEDYGGMETLVSKIVTIITYIGMTTAILMSALIGIKYMLGSIEEKAEYKKEMIPYLIGAVLVFGICTIVKILQSVGSSIN